MDIAQLLAFGVKQGASDLHLSAGLPPMIRVDGDIRRINVPEMDHKQVHDMIYDIMSDKQRKDYEEFLETDFSFEIPGLARFRVNAFNHNRGAGGVFRTIPSKILSLEDLNAPKIFQEISEYPRGIVLVTGPTGSGKSTTLAGMVDYKNDSEYGHILTVEDPIEFVHESKKCLVNQREVHRDTLGFNEALRSALREDPDTILVGEIRDREAMDHAIAFAETGHLCLSTLHANSTNQALDRIINFFPDERRMQLLMDLSLNLKGLISQRLIPNIDGVGRIPAIEVMLNTPLMADMIFKGEVHEMKSLIAKSNEAGMQTFDQALYDLYEEEKITFEDALRNADSVNDIRLRIKLESNTARKTGVVEDHREFELEESDDDQAGGMI